MIIKKILISFILCLIAQVQAYTQSDLRVGIGLRTIEADDQYCDESFIAGYESAGGHWSGSLTKIESLTGAGMEDTSLSGGYDLLTWNSGGDPTYNQLALGLNSSRGLQYFIPAGSNLYRLQSNTRPLLDQIICGAGYDSNNTGYSCEFWDRDPYRWDDTVIRIVKGGTQFTITKVIRVSSTVIGIRFSGDSLNVNGFEHGFPIRIVGLSGTDISPLPSGLYYPTYGSGGYLIFSINTSSGTIGAEQAPSAGTIKTGTADNRILIRTSHWNYPFNGYAYTIFGVTGFTNNPNRPFPIFTQNNDGYGDKFEVVYDIGSGSYTGGGRVSNSTQSYTTPYIAGKIAFIKDSVEHLLRRPCSWWEARYRARMTASENGTYHVYNGYGRINVLKAIRYRGNIPGDGHSTLKIGKVRLERTAAGVVLQFDLVQNATHYIIFNNGTPIDTITAASYLDYGVYPVSRTNSRVPNKYSYVALRDNLMSEESVPVVLPYYYYKKMRIK